MSMRIITISPDPKAREGFLARVMRRVLLRVSPAFLFPRYMDWYAARYIAPRARTVSIVGDGVEDTFLMGPCDTLRITTGCESGTTSVAVQPED